MTARPSPDTFTAAHRALSMAIVYLGMDPAPYDERATYQAISILLYARKGLPK